jgi:hypothetical protein
LFIADLVSTGNTGNGSGAGVIYQLKSLVNPTAPTLGVRTSGSRIELTWDCGILQKAEDIAGPWNDVVDAFSPHVIQPAAPRGFYRTRF